MLAPCVGSSCPRLTSGVGAPRPPEPVSGVSALGEHVCGPQAVRSVGLVLHRAPPRAVSSESQTPGTERPPAGERGSSVPLVFHLPVAAVTRSLGKTLTMHINMHMDP